MLQPVFNKILKFPLDQFWVEKHGCVCGREGGGGKPPLYYLHLRQFPSLRGRCLEGKGKLKLPFPFLSNACHAGQQFPFKRTAMIVAEFVCMVSIFCIVLPQFVIAMTMIFYSETSIKRTPN